MTTQAERLGTVIPRTCEEHIELVERYSAHNYHPLPVVVAEGEGCWVTDVDGNRYLDLLSAYSALNFGHRHPELVSAAKEQLDRLTLTSRAFHNDQLGPFLRDLADLCGMDLALPMNSGAEGVETALKTARKWGYEVKGVAPDRAKVIVCDGNFHGRTISIISFSTDEGSRRELRPPHAGVRGRAVRRRRRARGRDRRRHRGLPRRAGPGRGRRDHPARRLSPPRCARSARERNVLLIADEIQTGLGPHRHRRSRSSTTTCGPTCSSSARRSAAGSSRSRPSSPTRRSSASTSRGSTAARSAATRSAPRSAGASIAMLRTGELQENSRRLGDYLAMRFREAALPTVEEARDPRSVGRDPADARGPAGPRGPPSASSSRASSRRTRTSRRSGSPRRS